MDEKLKEIRERLNAAYELTEFIPANGQNLDRLAMVRQELRNMGKTLNSVLDETGKEDGHG